MRKLSNVVIMTILVTGLCLAFLSTCVVEDDTPSPGTFSEEPGLALVSGSASITYTLTPSDPAADDYDLWYRAGNFTTAADIKDGGTWVRGRLSGNTTIAGLINGQMYSVVVTANKSGYNSSDSRVRRATPNLATFTTAPALALSFGNSSIGYTWTASDPAADNYTVYWRQGAYTNAADVKDGIAITNAASGGVITGLANGQPYSVVVTANKAGSQSIDSEVIQATPNMGTFTTMPALALTSGINKITYTWNASDPAADSYTVYWRQGVYTNAADVKDGIAITNAASGGEITSLTNGQFYSVVVTAAKTDYTPGDSVVMQTMPNAGTFTAAPGQPTLTAGPGTLACTWSASSPAAATYDIYYVSGNTTSVAAIKAGTHIANVTSPYTITGLTGGQQYSVLITAHSAGYNSSDSTPRTGTPNLMNFTAAPGQPTLTAGIGTLACTWSASSPAAAAYDIYYVSG
ncbi:MAG: fibronectin type III domain-containing protein, partial [Treponema sp.]|nr:fibronectin type III domain-containing protein [Treponema sp.]